MRITHLEDIIGHLEHDDVLHAQVLLHEVHAFHPLTILKRVFMFTVETIHDVSSKVFEQIHLALEVFRKLGDGIVLTNVYGPLTSRRHIIEVTEG